MGTVEATAVIDAPPSVVWDVLVAGEDYAEWNPLITEVSGELVAAARPRPHIAPSGKRGMTFRPRVLDATPDGRPSLDRPASTSGTVRREHESRLVATDGGGVQLTQGETFSGVPLPGSMLESTRQGFEAMHAAVRERAEARANRR